MKTSTVTIKKAVAWNSDRKDYVYKDLEKHVKVTTKKLKLYKEQ